MGMVFNANRFTETLRTKDGTDSIQIPGKSSITVPDIFIEDGCILPAGVSIVKVHVVDDDVSVPGASQPVIELVEAPKTETKPEPTDQKKIGNPPKPPKSGDAQ